MRWLRLGLLSPLLALQHLGVHATDPTSAVPVELYKAEAIVTGREEEERRRGFREGIAEIVLKLTGEYTLEASGGLRPFLDAAGSFVREFSYEDRMKNIPVHDEQGTRERPYFLRMTADEVKFGKALEEAGLTIWSGRPDIEVLLTVHDRRGNFMIGAEEPDAADRELLGFRLAHSHYDGYEQREVLKDAAKKRGLKITMPGSGDLQPKQGRQQDPICPFHRPAPAAGCIRYRGDLTALSSGRWRLAVQAWGFSPEGIYADEPVCYRAVANEVTYDMALRESLEAFATWARRDANAIRCGLR